MRKLGSRRPSAGTTVAFFVSAWRTASIAAHDVASHERENTLSPNRVMGNSKPNVAFAGSCSLSARASFGTTVEFCSHTIGSTTLTPCAPTVRTVVHDKLAERTTKLQSAKALKALADFIRRSPLESSCTSPVAPAKLTFSKVENTAARAASRSTALALGRSVTLLLSLIHISEPTRRS
eukprot:1348050-Prymnesium_polylepis.1